MFRFRTPAGRRPRAASTTSHPSGPSRIEPLETRVLFVAGELDLNFSVDGKAYADFGAADAARAVVVQPDGKTVVAGEWDGGRADFAIARYDQAGNPDLTFDADGRQNVFFGASIIDGIDRATSVALQADGKIVVAGYTNFTGVGANNDFAVARLNPDGSLDNTFSGDGKFTHNFGNDDRAAGVALQADGKIVVVGSWDGGAADFAVIRLNANGTLDTTFNDLPAPTIYDGDGKAHINFGGGSIERATCVAIAGNGDIVLGGYTNFGVAGGNDTNDFAVARLTSAGVLNPAFSGDGRQTIDFSWNDQANAIAIDRQQRILLAGFDDGGVADFAVARLMGTGTLDTTFNDVPAPNIENGDGRLSFTFGAFGYGGVERAFGIALEPNGIDQEIYVAGVTDAGGAANNFALARIRPNGTLDGSFGGGDGRQVTDMGAATDQAYGAAIGADGKVVVAGTSGGNFAVARYLAELDPAFGFDGKQVTDFGAANDAARAVAIQPDGRIVVAGEWDGGRADFAIARYLTNGNLDATFNGDGRQNVFFGASINDGIERATSVALQADGKIVVGGYTNTTGTGVVSDFAVARLNPNGSLDTTFNGTGKWTYNLGNDERVNAVAVQPDGKIVLVGSWDGGTADMIVMRLNSNGTFDTTFNDIAFPLSFNGDGKLDIHFGPDIGSSAEFATSVTIRPDGKIVVGGYTNFGTTGGFNVNDFAVAVVNPNGTLDTTFSGDGLFTVDFGYDDRASGVAVRPDGRIVVAGSRDDGTSDFAVAQIRGSGLDALFGGGDGKLELLSNDNVEFCTGMALLENGKIVMVGYSNSFTASANNFVVARVLADGSRADPNFNADGEHFIDFGGDDKAFAVAVQPDRKVVVVGSSNGNFAAARLDSAPVVTRVYFNSTQWAPVYRSYLVSHGLGSVDFGYAIPAGPAQLNELPWYQLNEISISFSELVDVQFNDLAVRGINTPTYAFDPAVGAILTPVLRTVTWRLPPGVYFTKDKLILDVDGDSANAVRTALGAVLDGDWSGLNEVFPSGDGSAGGDFRFRVNVLPGDVNGSGAVLAQDFADVKKKFFSDTTSPVTGADSDYTPFHDIDGSGFILAIDFAEVKKRFFDQLPIPEPLALALPGTGSSLFGSDHIRPADELLA